MDDGDIWDLPVGDQAATINETYQLKWRIEIQKAKSKRGHLNYPSLVRATGHTIGYLFLLVSEKKKENKEQEQSIKMGTDNQIHLFGLGDNAHQDIPLKSIECFPKDDIPLID